MPAGPTVEMMAKTRFRFRELPKKGSKNLETVELGWSMRCRFWMPDPGRSRKTCHHILTQK